MKNIVFIILLKSGFVFSQKNDTLFLYFEKNKMTNSYKYISNKKDSIYDFIYTYNCFKDSTKFLKLVTYSTFEYNPKPIYKRKDFLKKTFLHKCSNFKKMGYEKSKELLTYYNRSSRKIYLIDMENSSNNKLYVREVNFLLPHLSE